MKSPKEWKMFYKTASPWDDFKTPVLSFSQQILFFIIQSKSFIKKIFLFSYERKYFFVQKTQKDFHTMNRISTVLAIPPLRCVMHSLFHGVSRRFMFVLFLFFAEVVEDSKPAKDLSDAGEENQVNDQ